MAGQSNYIQWLKTNPFVKISECIEIDDENGYKSLDKNRSNRWITRMEIDGYEWVEIDGYKWIEIDGYEWIEIDGSE